MWRERNIFRQYFPFLLFFFLHLPLVHLAVLNTAVYKKDPLHISLTNWQTICKPFSIYDLSSCLQKRDPPGHDLAYRLCFMQLYPVDCKIHQCPGELACNNWIILINIEEPGWGKSVPRWHFRVRGVCDQCFITLFLSLFWTTFITECLELVHSILQPLSLSSND